MSTESKDQHPYLLVGFPEDDPDIKAYLDGATGSDNAPPLMTLGPIADINFFIGANNSGKSRMLRWLCKRRGFHVGDRQRLQALKGVVGNLNQAVERWSNAFTSRVPSRVFDLPVSSNAKRLGLDGHLSIDANTPRILADKAFACLHVDDPSERERVAALVEEFNSIRTQWSNSPDDLNKVIGAIHQALGGSRSVEAIADGIYKQLANVLAIADLTTAPERTYVPTLRTSQRWDKRGIQLDPSDPLREAVLRNYFTPEGQGSVVVAELVTTGQRLFADVLKARNSDPEQRRRFGAFERFVSNAFFAGRSLDIVASIDPAHYPDEIVVRLEGEVEPRRLFDLGDGIQALLLLLHPIFMAPNGAWIFIEEPETHLHPGFQRLFLETLLNNEAIKNKKLKFFFTTHSNHFIDYSIEHDGQMSVFAFAEAPKDEQGNQRFTVRNVVGPDRDVLRDLGVRNGSVLLANCAIWVEGPTDRKYVRAFLNAFMKHAHNRVFREDLHFAFFEYGGSLLDHYDFADAPPTPTQVGEISARFVANRVFLLADKDRGKEANHKALKDIQKPPHFVYRTTPGREVENLLSKEQLIELTRNWSSAPDLSRTVARDYRNEGLGAFLKTKRCSLKLTKKGSMTGTLKTEYKNKLADALGEVVTWDNMSEDARKLTKDIYKFISDHNVDVK